MEVWDFKKHENWKRNNPYYGKKFSILGDSISTLEGYIPEGYKVYYYGERCERTGVREMQDTWWGKVIDYFGGELLVNNSWSGSRVTKLPNQAELFPSGCSSRRTGGLHKNSVKPDVIIVYLGTNDWGFGAVPEYTDYRGEELTPWNEEFKAAYGSMLDGIKQNYPQAEIWCCTLPATYMSAQPSFKFPYTPGRFHLERYNEIIREVSVQKYCRLIDFFAYREPYDSIDGTHPVAAGMSTIATMAIRSIADEKGAEFLNWE